MHEMQYCLSSQVPTSSTVAQCQQTADVHILDLARTYYTKVKPGRVMCFDPVTRHNRSACMCHTCSHYNDCNATNNSTPIVTCTATTQPLPTPTVMLIAGILLPHCSTQLSPCLCNLLSVTPLQHYKSTAIWFSPWSNSLPGSITPATQARATTSRCW
jgi:hypothetical protein